MTEPVVTLTDYALALEGALFATRLSLDRMGRRAGADPLAPWLVLFFAAAGLAPALGGTVHGFFPDASSPGYRVLWPATLLAIGLVAYSMWMVSVQLFFLPKMAKLFQPLALANLLIYSGWVCLLTWHQLQPSYRRRLLQLPSSRLHQLPSILPSLRQPKFSYRRRLQPTIFGCSLGQRR